MHRTCSTPLGPEHYEAVRRVLDRGVLVQGPETAALEVEFASWLNGDLDPYRVVAVSSGTAALTALLLAHGVGRGAKVAVPAVTFTATALAVIAAGAEPVFVDVNATWNLCPTALAAIQQRVRLAAVIGVDLHGVPAAWGSIERAVEPGVLLIEDACPAYGARYDRRPAGLLGRHGAAFSLNESKQLPAGEGGFVIAPNATVAERIRRMRHFGHASGGKLRAAFEIGNNWKITEMAAALARAGLPSLTDRVMTARLNGSTLRSALGASPSLSAPPIPVGAEPSWFKMRALAGSPEMAKRMANLLMREGVAISRDEVAPLPEHLAFQGLDRGATPNAHRLHRTFCIGSRAKPIFDLDPTEAKRWAGVVRCLPSS